MTPRQRILTALRHEEPDRVPLDLGGSGDTTILAVAYRHLRQHLGLPVDRVRVDDPCQHTAVVEDDVRASLDIDTQFVFREPLSWRPGSLPDGSPAEFPARFRPERREDGSQVTRDHAGHVVLLMPRTGQYFDRVYAPLADASSVADIEHQLDAIENYDSPSYLDMPYERLGERAKKLHEQTDRFLIGYFGGHIFQAGQGLRGWDTFLADLLVHPRFAEALMDRLAEANVARFEHFARTVAPHVDAILFEDDLGAQDRPLLSPALYRRLVKPYHARLFRFAKSRCRAHLILHTDGAVRPLIPDFIEMGIDALNPVQVSATGMDPGALKRDFGNDIAFWGGGCDTQHVLPFASPQEVADEVKRRIDQFAPGGGYVFAAVHNIQTDVPPANVVSMFRTAREYGIHRPSIPPSSLQPD